jgi:hypothetical protein
MADSRRKDWLATLDDGIAPFVDVLDAAGIETFESCEGTEGHGFLEPTVRFYGDNSEGFRALAVAVQRELPVSELRRCPLYGCRPCCQAVRAGTRAAI